MLLTLAVRLAWSRHIDYRWRQVAFLTGCFLCTVLLLGGMSIVQLFVREDARDRNRLGTVASTPAPTDLLMQLSFENADGQSIMLLWVEPATSEPPVLPPGLETLPDPGTMIVSPALAQLIERDEALRARFRVAGVLDASGVPSAGDLFAYVRPGPGRTLRGDVQTVRIARFGGPDGTFPPSLRMEGDRAFVMGLVFCLGVPTLIVLTVVLSAASRSRDRRLALLRALGVARLRLAVLAAYEATILATPGILAAAASWMLLTRHLDHVPLTDRPVFPGDLSLPLPIAAGGALAFLFGVFSMSLFSTSWSLAWSRPAGRPSLVRSEGRVVRFAFPIAALASFALSARSFGRGQEGAFVWFVISAVFCMLTVPILYEALVRAIGALLSLARTAEVWLAGRQLAWDPVRLTRPYAALGTVVLLGITLVTYRALQTRVEVTRSDLPHGPVSVVLLGWSDPQPEDIVALRSRLPGIAVFPGRFAEDGVELGVTCYDLAQQFRSDPTLCSTGPFTLPDTLAQDLVALIGGVPLRLVPAERVSIADAALVVAPISIDELDRRVADAAWATGLVAPSRLSLLDRLTRLHPEVMQWVDGGIDTVTLSLGIGALLGLVDRVLLVRWARLVLWRIGLTQGQRRRIDFVQVLVPALLVILLSALAGIGLSVPLSLIADVLLPSESILLVIALAILGVMGTTCIVVVLGERIDAAVRENVTPV